MLIFNNNFWKTRPKNFSMLEKNVDPLIRGHVLDMLATLSRIVAKNRCEPVHRCIVELLFIHE